MTIAITCSCSSQLEVDESFAGKTITCPDCQATLDVPAATSSEAMRTSALALASVVFALLGAVTVVGTVLAIVLGVMALMHIGRQPNRVAGRYFAWTGIVLGFVLTPVGWYAWTSADLLGLDPVLRHTKWAGKLDYSGPLAIEVKSILDAYAIDRPSRAWGVLRNPDRRSKHSLNKPRRLLMVNPAKSIQILVLPITQPSDASWDKCEEMAKEAFHRLELSGLKLVEGTGNEVEIDYTPYKRNRRRYQQKRTGVALLQFKADKIRGNHVRTFLVRIAKRDTDSLMYVLVGGTEKSRFGECESEIAGVLDSFRILDGAGGKEE